jgi:hypothetical protein
MEIISFFDINDAYMGKDGQYTSIYDELTSYAHDLAPMSIYSNYGEIIGDKLVEILAKKWKAVSIEKKLTINKPFYFRSKDDMKLLVDLFEGKVDIEGIYMTVVNGFVANRVNIGKNALIVSEIVVIGVIVGLMGFLTYYRNN